MVALATVVVFLIGVAEIGEAALQGAPPFGSLLLTTADLPPGFAQNPMQSGPVSRTTARALGGNPASVKDLGPGLVRAWAAHNGVEIRIAVVDLYNTMNAAEAIQGARRSYHKHGLSTFNAPTVAGGVGGAWDSPARKQKGVAIGFARGSMVFTVIVIAPSWFPDRTLVALSAVLSARELRHESARYHAGEPVAVGAGGVVSAAVGAIVGYLLVLSIWAYLRDPLARARWSRRRRATTAGEAAVAPDRGSVLDVTADARALKRVALAQFAASLIAFGVTLSGFRPNPLTTRVILWSCGLAIALAAALYRRRRIRRSGGLWMITGQRPLSATVLFVVAIVTAVLACASLLAGTLGSSGAPDSQAYLIAAACFVAVAGVAHRRARRLSALAADAAIRRDPRPPVLYLRSFGDDALRMRSATLGRASLVDRLSPGRFDSFEEIIVRHLSAIGPVVAVNRPGTSLAPLGAARETIAADDWHSALDHWIERSVMVVIGAPPGAPSPGLVWELGHLSAEPFRTRWIVVVVPVAAERLRERWRRFASETAAWPAASELGCDPGQVLAMDRSDGRWRAITARQRTEWTYAAALRAVAGELPANSDMAPARAAMPDARPSAPTPSRSPASV